jgi:branched-chain amino acid transport system substrate-binding protein
MRRGSVRLCASAVLLSLMATALGMSGAAGAAGSDQPSTTNAPGVTRTRITTGAIGTLTGPLATDLSTIVPGVRAYFDMVNAEGGVDGRTLDLAYSLNDLGDPSEFSTLVRQLVDQDHVFAVTGVGTDFFSPDYLAETGTPTYGYNTTGGWAGPPNLFGSDGSIQCYSCLVPDISYVIKQNHDNSVALLAYNVSASSDLCATAARLLERAGIHISYEDLSAPIDGNLAPDVQRITTAHSDFVVSCMDTTGNISMARAIKQYGLKVNQLWFNGYDQSVIRQYSSLMQGVYFFLPNVPLTAPTRYYPGLATYFTAMRKYEPQYADSALAIQGWESAALFVAGVRAAGNDLTQARVVKLTNQLSAFSDGVTPPVNWTDGHLTTFHVPADYPVCAAITRVEGSTLKSVYGHGHEVFLCLAAGNVKDPVPIRPPAGTPGT